MNKSFDKELQELFYLIGRIQTKTEMLMKMVKRRKLKEA